MRPTYRTKLLAGHVGLVLAVILLLLYALDRSLGEDLTRELDQRLEQQAIGAAQWVTSGRHPDRLAGRLAAVVDAQVTIFDREGRVLGEAGPSDAAEQLRGRGIEHDEGPAEARAEGPSHAGDPEIAAARSGGVGRAARRSPADARMMRFVAVPAGEGLVVRLAVPLSGIESTLGGMRRRLLFAGGLAVVAALGLGLVASRVAARPLRAMIREAQRIADGDYAAAAPSTSPDEFGVLSRALASLAQKLGHDMAQIRRLETMRRDFVANVSHELRTPVTAIQGYAETLQRADPGPGKRAEFLEIIHRHARRLGALLERLLLLSDLEARAPEEAVREPVPLGSIAENVVLTVKERREAAGAGVEVAVDPRAIAVGDPAGIEQVIENLVDNALKYGRIGGTVRITGERAGDRVRLAVIDDGPGVGREHLGRLFERFYRVDPGRSRERGGTGLGLSIVKHLVESMGGSVAVESDPGQGCRFTVDLPAAPA
jgi:signal transduction histidine kinase